MHREAGARGERHQSIEAELADTAAQQVVQARLRHAEPSRSLCLGDIPCRTASLTAMMRRERSFMFPVRSGCLPTHPRRFQRNRWSSPPRQLFPQLRRRQIHIPFLSLPCFPLECAEHVNRIPDGGDVDHSESTGALANPDFTNACADRRHWPSIIGVEPSLHPVQLVARSPSGMRRSKRRQAPLSLRMAATSVAVSSTSLIRTGSGRNEHAMTKRYLLN
jgi:hypothetical protein